MIAREPVERREEAVPRRVHLAAAVSPELAADDLVVPVDPLLPGRSPSAAAVAVESTM
jgi:hypothetical protein